MSLPRRLLNCAIGMAAGALAGALALVAIYASHPSIDLDVDRLTAVARGFYDAEHAGHDAFAWTGREATLALPGLDRRRPWTCTIRLRAGRADPTTLPRIALSVDGARLLDATASNDYQDVRVTLPPRPDTPGAIVALTPSNTFKPGPDDPRDLGVMVERWACAPDAAAGAVLPPRRAIASAARAGAMLGSALGFIAGPGWALAAGVLLIAVVQGVPLAWGFAPFSPYTTRVVDLAAGIAVGLIGLAIAAKPANRLLPSGAARAALFVTALAAYWKLLGLLHPDKLLIDAVFHAHRLEWVMSGRYFFTQPLPSGVQFPYAIGLYVFASPWAGLVRDHVLLLRIVVATAEALAGALLYLLIVRTRGDRVAGLAAVLLFNVVPLMFGIVGNANLTNAFGQSVALVAIVSAVAWLDTRADWGRLVAVLLLSTFAFLCHVSTFALLAGTLIALATVYRLFGGAALARHARSIFVATLLGAVAAVAIYYAHFPEVYPRLTRLRDSAPAGAPATTAAGTPFTGRIVAALDQSAQSIGWPLLALAAVGVGVVARERSRDRLTYLLVAWGAAFVVFLGVGALSPVSGPLERYAAEFVGRVVAATYPAAVVLAALAISAAWRSGHVVARLAAMAGIVAAVYTGVIAWLSWLR